MRKILKFIGIFNFCLVSNSTVIACASDHYISTSFFEIKGTSGELRCLTHNKNNIYAGSTNGNVYKSNGRDNFEEMTGTNGSIDYLATDNSSNIYAQGEPGNIYAAKKDSINFVDTEWAYGTISFFTQDNKDGIWAGTHWGGVYTYSNEPSMQSWKEKTIFTSLGGLLDLKINKYGVIYVLNDKGDIFKCFNSEDEQSIKKIWTKKGMTNLLIDDYNNVYALGNDEIYKSDGDNQFNKIYSCDNFITKWTVGSSSDLYFITAENKIYELSSAENDDNYEWNEIGTNKKIEGNLSCITLFKPKNKFSSPLLIISTSEGKVYASYV